MSHINRTKRWNAELMAECLRAACTDPVYPLAPVLSSAGPAEEDWKEQIVKQWKTPAARYPILRLLRRLVEAYENTWNCRREKMESLERGYAALIISGDDALLGDLLDQLTKLEEPQTNEAYTAFDSAAADALCREMRFLSPSAETAFHTCVARARMGRCTLSNPLVERWGFRTPTGHKIAYVPLVASMEAGMLEFSRESVDVACEEASFTLPAALDGPVRQRVEALHRQVRERGDMVYDNLKCRPTALYLHALNPNTACPEKLRITIGSVSFMTNRQIKQMVFSDEALYHNYVVDCFPTRAEEITPTLATMSSGAGCLLITGDGHLMLSHNYRNREKGLPDIFSYSAAGSCDYAESVDARGCRVPTHPFDTIRLELQEEVGIAVREEDLRLVAIGFDALGLHLQYGFLARTALSFSEVLEAHQCARSRDEQILLPIPFDPHAIETFRQAAYLEPTTDFMLCQIVKKVWPDWVWAGKGAALWAPFEPRADGAEGEGCQLA